MEREQHSTNNSTEYENLYIHIHRILYETRRENPTKREKTPCTPIQCTHNIRSTDVHILKTLSFYANKTYSECTTTQKFFSHSVKFVVRGAKKHNRHHTCPLFFFSFLFSLRVSLQIKKHLLLLFYIHKNHICEVWTINCTLKSTNFVNVRVYVCVW